MSDESEIYNTAETVRAIMLENRSRQIQTINGFPCLVDKNDEVTVLTGLMALPVRPKLAISVRSLPDLVSVINRETKALGETYEGRGFAEIRDGNPRFLWILDAEQEGQVGWRQMLVRLDPQVSRRFADWRRASNTWMSQAEFGDFLEDNYEDVMGEDAAKLLTIARNLEATQTSKFTSSSRPEIGDATIHWETETNTGDISIPQSFQIGLPLYSHTEPYKLLCSLKLRVREGTAKFLFKITNQDQVILDIFEEWRLSLLDAGYDFIIGTDSDQSPY